LSAPDASSTDFFGFGTSLALRGDTLLVGAPGDDESAPNAGAVYLFRLEGAAWSQQSKLFALNPSAGAEFGMAVAISGHDALIGANSQKFAPVPDNGPGSAYVYRVGGTITDMFTYVAHDGIASSKPATVTITIRPPQ
jgi:hypothetical protein